MVLGCQHRGWKIIRGCAVPAMCLSNALKKENISKIPMSFVSDILPASVSLVLLPGVLSFMHSAPASCRNFQSKTVLSTPLPPVKCISKMLFSGSLSDGAEIRGTVISSNRRFDSSTICSRALALAGSHWWAPRQLSRPHWLPLGVLPTHPQELLTSGRFTHTWKSQPEE